MQVLVSRWLGASTAEATLLSKMSEMMRKDVDKALAEASSGKPQPSRFTRKEMLAREAAQVHPSTCCHLGACLACRHCAGAILMNVWTMIQDHTTVTTKQFVFWDSD